MKRERLIIICLEHRESNVHEYTREYFVMYYESEERISILTSHLITGYEAFSLSSQILCGGKCSIKTNFKFNKNPKAKIMERSFLSFFRSLSLFSCFYVIYPLELSEIYLLTYHLIYLYMLQGKLKSRGI